MRQTERRATKALAGRRIVRVRYMTEDEARALYWTSRAVVLELDDGTLLWPMSDDEGNDAGALASSAPEVGTLPRRGAA